MTKVLNVLLERGRSKTNLSDGYFVSKSGAVLYFYSRLLQAKQVIEFLAAHDYSVVNIFQPNERIADTEVYRLMQRDLLCKAPTASVVVGNYIVNLKSPFAGLKNALYDGFPLIINVFVNNNCKNALAEQMHRASLLIMNYCKTRDLCRVADVFRLRKLFQVMKASVYHAVYRPCSTKRIWRAYSCGHLETFNSRFPSVSMQYDEKFRRYVSGKLFDSQNEPFSVYIALYSLTRHNIGAYHSGVVMLGTEVAYCGGSVDRTGVYFTKPGENKQFHFLRFVDIGHCNLPFYRVVSIICDAADNWRTTYYNIVTRNCNDFSNLLCILLCHYQLPAFVNKLAHIGRRFV